MRTNLLALEVLEAAISAPTIESSADAARQMAPLVLLTEDDAVQVAAVLAVLAVWSLPPATETPRSAGAIRFRLAQVRGWLLKQRSDLTCLGLELTWRSS